MDTRIKRILSFAVAFFMVIGMMPVNVVRAEGTEGDDTEIVAETTAPETTPHVCEYAAVVTASTCEAAGFTTYTCSCGDTYTADEVEATGHTYGEDDKCACGALNPAHEHSYTSVVTAPTCDAAGYTTNTCVCGDVTTTDEVEATGHTYGEDDKCACGALNPEHAHSYTPVVTAPTCDAAGFTTNTCACGDVTTTDEVAATGHTYGENGKCACGALDPAHEHAYVEGKCVCGDERIIMKSPAPSTEPTVKPCEEGCWMEEGHEGECEIICTKDERCVLEDGHEGQCEAFGGVILVDLDKITTEAEFLSAVAIAQAGQTIVLQADITLTNPVTLPAGIILDGNGKTISGAINAGGDLTFKGRTIVTNFDAGSGNTITIGEGASLKVAGSRITVSYGNVFDIRGNIPIAKSADKTAITPSLELVGGISFNGNGGGVQFNVEDAYVILGNSTSKDVGADGVFNINFTNSIVDFTNALKTNVPTAAGLDPTFNITAKDSAVSFASHLELWNPNTNLTLDNTDFIVGGSFANAGKIVVRSGADFTVKAPIMSSHGGNTGTITVDGGEFELVDSNEDWVNEGTIKVAGDGTLKINDFKCADDGKLVVDITNRTSSEAPISGGDAGDLENVLGKIEVVGDAEASLDGDGKIVVRPYVARIGDQGYVSMKEVGSNVKNGETIVMIADENNYNLNLNKQTGIVLDLNGYTLNKQINLNNGAELTIKDTSEAKTGKVVVDKETNDTYAAIVIMRGTLTIEGGTIETTGDCGAIQASSATLTIKNGKIVSAGDGIQLGTWSLSSSKFPNKVSITGGVIEAAGKGLVDSDKCDGTIVEISGGTINSGDTCVSVTTGTAAVTGGTFSNSPESYVVKGYAIEESGGAYTVKRDGNLYVNVDYNTETAGWGTICFGNYSQALAYAQTNAKNATIVMEKTTDVSGNCIDQNTHKNLMQLNVTVKDGALLGNANSKWDMTYKVTLEPGAVLKSARNSEGGYIHVKNTLTVGEAGAAKKAYINFDKNTANPHRTMNLAILYNGKLIANNAEINVGDLGLTGSASFTDTTINVEGIAAVGKNNFYKHTMTNSTMVINGHNIMNEPKYFSTTGTLLHNLTMTDSQIIVNDNADGTAAEKVTIKNLTMNGSSLAVESDTPVEISEKLTMDMDSKIDAGEVTVSGSGSIVVEIGDLEEGAVAVLPINAENAEELVEKIKITRSGVSGDAVIAEKEGKLVLTNVQPAVKIGNVGFVSLDAALDAAKAAGKTEVEIDVLADVKFSGKVNNFNKVTFNGTNREQTVDMNINSNIELNTSLVFNDLTVSRLDGDWLYHYTYILGGLSFNNCKMVGLFNVTAQNTNFTGCDFYNDDTFGDGNYSLWLYSGIDGLTVNITDCTFDVYERAIKMYGIGYNSIMTLNISGTEFKSRTPDKTVVEMAYADPTGKGIMQLNISNSTKAGFGTPEHAPKDAGANAWFNVEDASTKKTGSIVTVDGVVVYTDCAAKIGNRPYIKLQEAVDAVKDGETITLIKNCDENVTLTEKVGLHYTIDGNEMTMTGTITINPLSDENDNRRITIKNVNFVTDRAQDFITAKKDNHYPRITVENCDFTGNGKGETVAIRLKTAYGAVIKNCTGTGLHSFLQNTAGKNFLIEGITVTNSKSAFALGTVQGVTVRNCNITAGVGYGIRLDGGYNNNAVIENCKISAFIPVVLRSATVNTDITFNGSNTLTQTNTDGIKIALGKDKDDYQTNGVLPAVPTVRVVVTVNDPDLNAILEKDYKTLVYGAQNHSGNKYLTVMPEGTLSTGTVKNTGETAGSDSHINFEITDILAQDAIEIKLYAGNTLLSTTKLVATEYLTETELSAKVEISDESSSWETEWVTVPNAGQTPDRAELYIDGIKVSETNEIDMYGVDDPSQKRNWADIDGVATIEVINGSESSWYNKLSDALNAAKDGATVKLHESTKVIATNGKVDGNRTITITGNALVNWGAGFLFVGRGGEGNGTLIFDNAKLTSKSNNSTYGINVSGHKKNSTDTNDGTLILRNSTIDLDYLINKGTITLDGSTLNVKNGFSVGGRAAAETETGKDATAYMNLNNGSKLVVHNHNGMGLGHEAVGIMNVVDSSVEFTQDFLITEKGVLNVQNGTVKSAKKLENKGTIDVSGETTLDIVELTGEEINLLDGAIIVDSKVGGNAFVAGNVIFRGDNEFNMIFDFGELTDYYGTTANMKWTVEAGGSLVLTQTSDRYGLGYGDDVTINGELTNALAQYNSLRAEDASFSVNGISMMNGGWSNKSYMTVNDAYVIIGRNSSFGNQNKNKGGDYTVNFNNSVLSSTRVTVYEPGSAVNFNFANSVAMLSGAWCYQSKTSTANFTNSVLSATGKNGTDSYNTNAGTMNLIGSSLNFTDKFTNIGTITMDVESMITTPTLSGTGKIIIDTSKMTRTEKVQVISGTTENTLTIEAGNAAIEITESGVWVYFDTFVDKNGNGTIDAGEGYGTLEAAVAAAADGQTIYILHDTGLNEQAVVEKDITITALEPKEVSAAIVVKNGATLTLGENVTFEAQMCANGGAVVVDGAVVTARIHAEKGGTITVNSGAVDTASATDGNSALNVTGGSVTSASSEYGAQINVSGGTVGSVIANKMGFANISGGEITNVKASGEGAAITITGSEISGSVVAENDGNILIIGGWFASDPTTAGATLAQGMKWDETTGYIVHGDYVAFIDDNDNGIVDDGETGFETIEEAVAAENETVKLLNNLTGEITIEKSVTIDLNGYKTGAVTVKSGDAAIIDSSDNAGYGIDGEITVEEGAGLELADVKTRTIKASGKLTIGEGAEVESIVANTGADVVINDGTINEDISVLGGSVTIKGGRINGEIAIEEDADENASIDIFSGIFGEPVPAEYCADGYIPVDYEDGTYGVELSVVRYIDLSKVADGKIKAGDEVYIDGDAYPVGEDMTVEIPNAVAKKSVMVLTTYTYKNAGQAGAYPTAMYVWLVKGDKNADGDDIYDTFKTERVSALDNFFKYEGTSIRVGNAKNGIRFFTSVHADNANKLMQGKLITSGDLAGVKMVSAGTEFWKTADNKQRSEVYGGKVGSTFRVFQSKGVRNWFTGVLTGLNTDAATIKETINNRPYAQLKLADGTIVTLYGGTLGRSILYVATQNRNTFGAGTASDNFIEGLIAKGNK